MIMQYDVVVLGDMPSHERNLLLKYCYMSGIRSYSVPKISDVLLRSSDELNLFDTPLMLVQKYGFEYGAGMDEADRGYYRFLLDGDFVFAIFRIWQRLG